MEPMLKASGTKRLRLKSCKLLSRFAFKFNLRRYNPVVRCTAPVEITLVHTQMGVPA